MAYRGLGPLFPVLRRLPQIDGFAHAVFDALGVLTGVALRMMVHNDRLTEGYPIHNMLHVGAGLVGLLAALVAVVLEAVGACFRAFDKAGVFIIDSATQFKQEVFSCRGPGGGKKAILLWCIAKPGLFHAL